MTILWLSIGLLAAVVLFFGWALCAAAKRGDEMTEDCPEFDMNWRERS